MTDLKVTLKERLSAVIVHMGYEFVGYELARSGKRSTLRIYIDTDDGVKLEDCSKVSRQVSAMLMVDDPIAGNYSLEISSPGLNRPLFEKSQYHKFIGQVVKIRTRAPQGDRRNFVGVLKKVEDVNITLLMDDEEVLLPFSNIDKAKVLNRGLDKIGLIL
jgi:ribosome maturation factor RimP